MAKARVRLYAKMEVEAALTDARFIAAGPLGFTLFWKGVAHSKLNLADGFVPEGAVPLIGAGASEKTIKDAVKKLLAIGLWVAVPGGYRTPEGWWEAEQVTAEQVEATRKKNADRQDRFRQKKAGGDPVTNPNNNGEVTRYVTEKEHVTNGEQTGYNRAQSTEHILPSGSSAQALAAAPAPSPGNGIDGQWSVLGQPYQAPVAFAAMDRLESWRKSGTRLSVCPSFQEIESLGEVLRTNRVTPDEFAEFVDYCIGKKWAGLPKDRIPKWLGERARGACISGDNSGSNPGGSSAKTPEELREEGIQKALAAGSIRRREAAS